MRIFPLYCFAIVSLLTISHAIAHGLRIKGNSYAIEERTAVDLFHYRSSLQHRKLSKKLTFHFDFRLDQPQGYGNMMRIKLDEPNKTLNVFCRKLDNGQLEVKLVEEGLDQLGTVLLDPQSFDKNQWIQLLVAIDLERQQITWHVHDNVLVIPFPYRTITYNNIFFGKSEFSIDIADFSIRNLNVSLDNEHIVFPLKERTGHAIHSRDGNRFGKVENPVWLINESYYWKAIRTIDLSEAGGYQFDAAHGNLLLFDRHRLHTLDLQANHLSERRFATQLPLDVRLGNSFLLGEKLYVYEVNNLPIDSPTVVAIDLATLRTNVVGTHFLSMQLHHHTGQPTDRIPYLLFGGFGNDRYSNTFLALDTQRGVWDTVATNGDRMMPRYFTASAYDRQTNNLYLFGGMGNEAADNTIGRIYRYDLYQLDLNTYRLRNLSEYELPDKNMVPVRNMVYDGATYLYTLLYPEYRSASALQLYRFSIKNGNFLALGDTIPIQSEKIKTNANLFYHRPLNTFYAVTQVFDADEITSQIKVYELKAPAVSQAELIQYDNPSAGIKPWLFVLLALIITAIIGYVLMQRHKGRPRLAPSLLPSPGADNMTYTFPNKNAIFLFGKFEVLDSKGTNIAHLFSSRLKQVLVLFLSRYPQDGIESSEFSTLLWPDKEIAATKNVRGVTLNQFRKLLAYLDGIALVYVEGTYRLEVFSGCFVDYLRFREAFDTSDATSIPMVYTTLERGKFLKHADHELLDDVKDDIDPKVVQLLLERLFQHFADGDYETVVHLARLCLETAPTDLDAFQYEIRAMLMLKQRTEAMRRFEHFQHFYQHIMNETLPIKFRDLDKRARD